MSDIANQVHGFFFSWRHKAQTRRIKLMNVGNSDRAAFQGNNVPISFDTTNEILVALSSLGQLNRLMQFRYFWGPNDESKRASAI